MERLCSCYVRQGGVRDIGVSNFGVRHMQKLLQTATVVPAVNQIELSPFLQRRNLVAYCRSKGVALEVGMVFPVIG